MRRSSWVLWFLLITLLARPVFGVASVSDFKSDTNLALADIAVTATHHSARCDMSSENASNENLSCCDAEGCGIDCMMAGCVILSLPNSALLFHTSFLTLYGGFALTERPVSLHFPFLRPPIA